VVVSFSVFAINVLTLSIMISGL